MPIYFIRHGQSAANAKGVFAGQRTNCRLTKLGKSQAEAAAKDIKNLGIDRIICSNLRRAQQTAGIIAKNIGFDKKMIEVNKQICEYDMGSLTGTPIREITPFELTLAKKAENTDKLRDRVLAFMNRYKDSPETILVVSHDGVYRTLEATKLGLGSAEFYTLPITPNATVMKLDLGWLDSALDELAHVG